MNELSIKLENCFGIKKLEKEFIFSNEHNVNIIYAKNGLMKTSFTKVFKKFQDGIESEIKDLIFNNTPVFKEIKVDEIDIVKEEIFVINSFEQAYESDSISSLLINNSMKKKLKEIIELKDNILSNLKTKSGLDLVKAVSTKGFVKLEEQFIKDFSFHNSFLQNCENIALDTVDYDFSNINYSLIFHKAVLNNIKKDNFQKYIKDYIEKSEEIYNDYPFFDKGKFNLPKLKSIEKELKTSNFFIKNNKIFLDGSGDFSDIDLLQKQIKEVENKLQSTKEFKAIDTALGTKEGKFLKDIIENNPEIIQELKLHNLGEFKKKLWLSYLKNNEDNFNDLKSKFIKLKDEISKLKIDETLWKKVIKLFNNRFHLPFKMNIGNPTSSIIGEALPKIIFEFKENSTQNLTKLNRDELEKKDTLSQGEKRALYLLNIIFDVEKRKSENQKTLFIIDDIADSFDYKNKYAIIEYLNDISKVNDFYMIILSHNFDFYRTISGRLNLDRKNKFHAIKRNDEIKIKKEYYQKQPLNNWKNNLNKKKNIIALIPFVRNLIEYGVDREVNRFSNIQQDELFLTNLLHIKISTKVINFGELKKVYLEYLGKDNFNIDINDTDKVYDLVINIANTDISDDDINLENKIILALAIRLKSEEFMIDKINDTDWVNAITSSQTRELFNRYSTDFTSETINIEMLESVNIMTPENIHLNSFMYEPLLDMDIIELKELYLKVQNL
jgi:hypothetical protein